MSGFFDNQCFFLLVMAASWTVLSGQGETKDIYSLNPVKQGKKIENEILP
jgi:hypothetical protein